MSIRDKIKPADFCQKIEVLSSADLKPPVEKPEEYDPEKTRKKWRSRLESREIDYDLLKNGIMDDVMSWWEEAMKKGNTCIGCPSYRSLPLLGEGICSKYHVAVHNPDKDEVFIAAALRKLCKKCTVDGSEFDDLISRSEAMAKMKETLDFLGSRETNAALEVLRKLPAVRKEQ